MFRYLKKWLEIDCQQQNTKKWVIDAIMKLASATEFKNHQEVKVILEKYSKNVDLELFQRVLCTYPSTQNQKD